MWLSPRPIADDISLLYREYYTHEPIAVAAGPRGMRRTIWSLVLAGRYGYVDREPKAWRRTAGNILARIGPLREQIERSIMMLECRPSGRLLDVGCGGGLFLARMREIGWRVMGVEPDADVARSTQDALGIEVFAGTLEDARFPSGSFDAITMNHVIEHVADPIGLLQECRRVLKPGGRIVILTPNSSSLGYRRFGSAWRGLEPPRHLFLFSPSTLARCAESAGLHVESIHTPASGARFIFRQSRLLQRRDRLVRTPSLAGPWLSCQAVAFWMFEYLLAKRRPRGEEVVMSATSSPLESSAARVIS